MMVMIGTALGAAILYGVAAAVEQRQAAAAPVESAGSPRLLARLARNPLWLLGFATQLGGFAVHGVALRSGHLAAVQMLVASELIVAVFLAQSWSGQRLRPASLAAAVTTVAGIGAFLFLTTPHGHGQRPGSELAAHGVPHGPAIAATLLGGAAAALLLAGLRTAGRPRAIWLAVAAGVADACSAVVTMAFVHVLGHGAHPVATSWTTYALVAAGIGNLLLTQTAYQAGYPLLTLPLISAVVPGASVAIGIGLLGETPRLGVAGCAGAVAAAGVTSLALAVLARSASAQSPAPGTAGQARSLNNRESFSAL
jgi:hypothetical protein